MLLVVSLNTLKRQGRKYYGCSLPCNVVVCTSGLDCVTSWKEIKAVWPTLFNWKSCNFSWMCCKVYIIVFDYITWCIGKHMNLKSKEPIPQNSQCQWKAFALDEVVLFLQFDIHNGVAYLCNTLTRSAPSFEVRCSWRTSFSVVYRLENWIGSHYES